MVCFIITLTSLGSEMNNTNILKNVNKIPFKRNISNVKNIKKVFKSSLLPLTLDENVYGKKFYSTIITYIDSINKVKRVVTELSITKFKKDIYTLKDNTHLATFIDEKLEGDVFVRHNTDNNTSIIIKKYEIIRSSTLIKLPIIKSMIFKKSMNTFNKHIGSFYLET